MLRQKQTAPELDLMIEDASGLIGFGLQKQTTVKFGLSATNQSTETILSLATRGIFAAQQRDAIQFAWAMSLAALTKPAQSLVAAVDKLISLTEGQVLAPLRAEDYQKLVTARHKLINAIGMDKNHPLIPLVHFMGNLIEKYEEDSNVKTKNETLDTDRRVAGADAVLKPHRPEKTGRPANLPRLKLADLLAEEVNQTAYEEIDTGPPVGNEVW